MRKPQPTVVELWDELVERHITHLRYPLRTSTKRQIVLLEKELARLTHGHCDIMLKAALAKAQRIVKEGK